MADTRYDIFFRGETLEGFDLIGVKSSFSALFKTEPQKTNLFFSGKVVALKKNLDKPTAARFKKALEEAGLKIYIKTSGLDKSTKKSDPSTESTAIKPNTDDTKENISSPQANEPHLTLLSVGSDVLTEAERTSIEPVNIETSHLTTIATFEPSTQPSTPPKQPDVSHLSTAEVGSDLLEGYNKAEIPLPIPDTSDLSLDQPGARLETLKQPVPAAPPSTSHIQLKDN